MKNQIVYFEQTSIVISIVAFPASWLAQYILHTEFRFVFSIIFTYVILGLFFRFFRISNDFFEEIYPFRFIIYPFYRNKRRVEDISCVEIRRIGLRDAIQIKFIFRTKKVFGFIFSNQINPSTMKKIVQLIEFLASKNIKFVVRIDKSKFPTDFKIIESALHKYQII